MRRRHAVERRISEIGEEDRRVAILGVVVDVKEDYFVLDDGTGIAFVYWDGKPVKRGDQVRVIGRPSVSEGVGVRGEVVQGAREIKTEVYWKVVEMEREVRA